MKILFGKRPSPILILILPILTGIGPALKGDILLFEDFETDGLGLRYEAETAFSDGSNDYFIRTDGFTEASGIPPYTNFGGNYFWAAEDVDSQANPTGTGLLAFSGVDLGGFEAIKISIDIGAGADNVFDLKDDHVHVQFRVDAGPWITALAFQNDGTTFNSSLHQDLDFDGIGEGLMLGLALQTFTSEAFPVSGNLLDLRIETMVNADAEAVAFDNILVTGIPEPGTYVLTVSLITGLLILKRRFLLRVGE